VKIIDGLKENEKKIDEKLLCDIGGGVMAYWPLEQENKKEQENENYRFK